MKRDGTKTARRARCTVQALGLSRESVYILGFDRTRVSAEFVRLVSETLAHDGVKAVCCKLDCDLTDAIQTQEIRPADVDALKRLILARSGA